MKVLSDPGIVFVRKNTPKGSEKELGMWPEGRPGRGSGSEPVYLQCRRIVITATERRRW